MHPEKFGVISKLQEIICLLAQEKVFSEAEETLEALLGIEICARQIQRVSEYYGEQLEEMEGNYQKGHVDVPLVISQKSKEPVYVTVDGSMVYRRRSKNSKP